MSMWKMVEVELVMYSSRHSITVSCVTTGPWMGIVTLEKPPRRCIARRSAILLMYRDFPMPDRVELTILTHKLVSRQSKAIKNCRLNLLEYAHAAIKPYFS